MAVRSELAADAVHALAEDAPVALALHLDHVTDPDLVTAAVNGPLRRLLGRSAPCWGAVD